MNYRCRPQVGRHIFLKELILQHELRAVGNVGMNPTYAPAESATMDIGTAQGPFRLIFYRMAVIIIYCIPWLERIPQEVFSLQVFGWMSRKLVLVIETSLTMGTQA
jgi:hypothetical protein